MKIIKFKKKEKFKYKRKVIIKDLILNISIEQVSAISTLNTIDLFKM